MTSSLYPTDVSHSRSHVTREGGQAGGRGGVEWDQAGRSMSSSAAASSALSPSSTERKLNTTNQQELGVLLLPFQLQQLAGF